MQVGDNNILPISFYLFLTLHPLDLLGFLPLDPSIIYDNCENWSVFLFFYDLQDLSLSKMILDFLFRRNPDLILGLKSQVPLLLFFLQNFEPIIID